MGGPWQRSFPIVRLCGTTETLCSAGANRLPVTSDPSHACTRSPQTRRSSHLAESRRLPSSPRSSNLPGRLLRANTCAGRRQRVRNLFSQSCDSLLETPSHGLCAGPDQRRFLSRTSDSSQQPAQKHHTPPTCINLFAGIGEFYMVLKRNGLKCVYANEPDPQARTVFERNHARSTTDLTLDHGDITQVPLERIPDHKLLAAWLPPQHRAPQSEKNKSWRARILKIVEAKSPPIVLLGTTHFSGKRERRDQRLPGYLSRSHRFAVHAAQELDALGYRTTFAYYDYPSFDLPLNRRNLFIVGVRADQNAAFKFKPPPGRSPGLGLHRCLLSAEEVQRERDMTGMETHLVDGVWTTQRSVSTGRIGELSWTRLDALPPNLNKLPYAPVGRWIRSDSPKSTSELIGHHLGFAMGLGSRNFGMYYYLVPGPDDRPMVRRLAIREAARLQGLPDEFLLHKSVNTASNLIGESGSPPIMDWVVKAIKEQFPHIFSTNDDREPSAEVSPHSTMASTGPS